MYNSQERGEIFPPDIEREIAKHLYESDRLPTSIVSKRWNEHKVWCTEEFIERMHTNPIVKEDVLRLSQELKESRQRRQFFVMIRRQPGRLTTSTPGIVKLVIVNPISLELITITHTKYFGYTINFGIDFDGDDAPDWNYDTPRSPISGKFDVKVTDILSTEDGIKEMFDMITPDVEYMVDPLTKRDIINRRLRTCDTEDKQLWKYFPDDTSSVDHKIYAMGVNIIMSNLSSHNLQHMDLHQLAVDSYNSVRQKLGPREKEITDWQGGLW